MCVPAEGWLPLQEEPCVCKGSGEGLWQPPAAAFLPGHASAACTMCPQDLCDAGLREGLVLLLTAQALGALEASAEVP